MRNRISSWPFFSYCASPSFAVASVFNVYSVQQLIQYLIQRFRFLFRQWGFRRHAAGHAFRFFAQRLPRCRQVNHRLYDILYQIPPSAAILPRLLGAGGEGFVAVVVSRGDFSWGAAPNPECKQVSCGFSSVRGVGRSPTLKIRALRNMLIGSTARSMRRSGNGMRLRRRRQVGRGRSPSPEGAARARAIFASLRS